MIMGFLISMKSWGLLTTFLLIFLGLCYWFKHDSKKTSILLGQITINACLHKLHSHEDTKLPTINLWVWILMCESDQESLKKRLLNLEIHFGDSNWMFYFRWIAAIECFLYSQITVGNVTLPTAVVSTA